MSPLLVQLLGILIFLGAAMGGPSGSHEGTVVADLAPSASGEGTVVADLAPSSSCGSVIGDVAPCLSYINKNMPEPSEACCKGCKSLASSAKTKDDRVQACNCIKDALGKLKSYDPNRISSLPKKCGVATSLPPIDPSFDCSKISYDGGVGVAW